MLEVHQYYPTGYRVLVQDGSRSEIKTDSDLNELLLMYRLNPAVVESFAFKDQLLSCAKRLFGTMDSFLKEQEGNSKLTPNARAFLKDTIQFICTGHRDVSMDAWFSIFSADHHAGNLNKRQPIPKDAKLLSCMKVPCKDVFWHWQQHRGGFLDLLLTCQLMFATDFS